MGRFRHDASGEVLTFAQDATTEEIRTKMREFDNAYKRRAVQAGKTRDDMRAEAGGGPIIVPPQPPSGVDMLEEFMGPGEAPQTSQAAPGAPSSGGGAPVPEPEPVDAMGAFLGTPGPGATLTPETPRAAMGRMVSSIGGIASMALGGAPAAVGGVVKAGAAKVLPQLASKLLGRAANVGTGAALTGAPIAAEEMVRGETPVEAIKHGAKYGLLGEALGMGVGKVVSTVAGRSKKLQPAAVKAQEALVPMGASLTPGQLTKSRTVRLMEGAAESGYFTGTGLRDVREKAHDVGQQLLRSHLDDLPERGGTVIANAYDDLGKMARGVKVDMLDPFIDSLNLRMAHQGRIPEVEKITDWVADLAAKYPDGKVPFDVAAALRSDLLGVERKTAGVLVPQKVHGAAKKLAGAMDLAMEAAIPVNKPQLHQAWRGTNLLVKKAVFREAAEDMLGKTLKEGQISGTQLATRLERLSKAERAKLDPAALKDFAEFAEVLRQTEKKAPGAAMAVFIPMMQAAALGGVIGGVADPDKLGVLAIPSVLSLILSNPRSARYLIQGIKGVGTKGGEELVRRAISTTFGQSMTKGAEDYADLEGLLKR